MSLGAMSARSTPASWARRTSRTWCSRMAASVWANSAYSRSGSVPRAQPAVAVYAPVTSSRNPRSRTSASVDSSK